jgi:DNA-directed RNA polymerase subunit RPC12/RpoP
VNDRINQFRLAMPKQFTKMTKLCARCGARVQYNDEKRCLVCPRCKARF